MAAVNPGGTLVDSFGYYGNSNRDEQKHGTDKHRGKLWLRCSVSKCTNSPTPERHDLKYITRTMDIRHFAACADKLHIRRVNFQRIAGFAFAVSVFFNTQTAFDIDLFAFGQVL